MNKVKNKNSQVAKDTLLWVIGLRAFRVVAAILASSFIFLFFNSFIYSNLHWSSKGLHNFCGFQPVSLTRQADLIRVASGGVVVKPIDKKIEKPNEDKIMQRLDGVASQLKNLPVAIVSRPCSESAISGGQNQKTAVGSPPSYSDWQQVQNALTRRSPDLDLLANPFVGEITFYLEDLWKDNGATKSANVSNSKDALTVWTFEEATAQNVSEKAVKIKCNSTLDSMTPDKASVIANALVQELVSQWNKAINGQSISIDVTDDSYNAICILSDHGGKTPLTEVKYGGKEKSKILQTAGKPYATVLVNTMSGTDEDQERNVRDWLKGTASSTEQSQPERKKPIVLRKSTLHSFPFVGTFESLKSDESHRRSMTLVWFDRSNFSSSSDIRFCLELNFGEASTLGRWCSKKITANYRLVTTVEGKTAVITAVPDIAATLYESWWFFSSPCNSDATAAQLAERFFPLYEQVYRSQQSLGKTRFKSPLQEEINRVKRWIEAAIQDQLYFKPEMENNPTFDPLNPVDNPPVDMAIAWARRVNGSDWWGLIQFSIAFCFLYPLVSNWIDCYRLRDDQNPITCTWRICLRCFVKRFCAIARRNDFLQRVRFSTRTMPLLGFLGTVVGISTSLAGAGGVLSEKLTDRQEVLSNMTQNLATAFDTTFVGICGSVALMCVEKILREKVED